MADVVRGKVQVEVHPRPFGGVIDKSLQWIGIPVCIASFVVDTEDDLAVRRFRFRFEQKLVLDVDVLSGIFFSSLNGDAKPVIHGGIADADVLAFEGGAVGNDMQVDPGRVPGVLVLKIIGIQLGSCREPSCQ